MGSISGYTYKGEGCRHREVKVGEIMECLISGLNKVLKCTVTDAPIAPADNPALVEFNCLSH